MRTRNPWVKNICEKIETLEPERTNIKDNVPPAERRALQELRENDDIIIKKADKTCIMVIMDRSFYKDKLVLNDHLLTETYEKVDPGVDRDVIKQQQQLITKHIGLPNQKRIQMHTRP